MDIQHRNFWDVLKSCGFIKVKPPLTHSERISKAIEMLKDMNAGYGIYHPCEIEDVIKVLEGGKNE